MPKLRRHFPHGEGLSTYSAVYVPSTAAKSKPISTREFNRRQDETRRFMAKEFGGSTTVRGEGTYLIRKGRGRGKLVKERVAIVENFSTPSDYRKKDKEIEKFVEGKATEWGQESIGYEFEEKGKRTFFFAEPHKKKKVSRL